MAQFNSFLSNCLAVVVGAIVAVVAGEVVIRYAAPQLGYRFPQGMFISDPERDYKLAPNFQAEAKTPEYSALIKTNSLGLRDSQEYGKKGIQTHRIVVLGDSFVMGVGVNVEETFVKALERRLRENADKRNYEVINTGVPGYNTRHELAYLRNDGMLLQPDSLILGFYIGNDIHDNYQDVRLRAINGYLQKDGETTGRLPASIRLFLETRSHLYRFLWPYVRRVTDKSFAKGEAQELAFLAKIYAKEEDEQARAMWRATKIRLRELANFALQHSLPLTVVIITDRYQVDQTEWERTVSNAPGGKSAYDRNKPNRRVLQYCNELGLPAIDLFPVFQRPSAQGPTYLKLDGHWTTVGNEIAAQAVYAFLLQHRSLTAANN